MTPGQQLAAKNQEINQCRHKDDGRDRGKVKETNPSPRGPAQKVADDDVASRADQSPLPAEQRTVGRTKQVTGWGEIALFADRQDDREKDQHDGRVIDEHREKGCHDQDRPLQQQFVAGTGAKEFPANPFGGAGPHHRRSQHEHGGHHNHRRAAKARETFLVCQDALPVAIRVWPGSDQRQRDQQGCDVRPLLLRPKQVQRPGENDAQGHVLDVHGRSLAVRS